MIKQKEVKIRDLDASLMTEITQCRMALKNLAKKQEMNSAVQECAEKKYNFSENGEIASSVVFFTNKERTPGINRVLDWVGVKNDLKGQNIFNGSISGVLEFKNGIRLNMQSFHFDHYPVSLLKDDRKAFKIIVFDNAFKNEYKNWKVALEVLGIWNSVVFTIDVSEKDVVAKDNVLDINSVYTKQFDMKNLSESLKQTLTDETIGAAFKIAQVKNVFEASKALYELIHKDLSFKENQLKGKSILMEKKQMVVQENATNLSNKDIGNIKSLFENELKRITKHVDEQIESFEKVEPESQTLYDDISSFLGFVERKEGRYIHLLISEGAVKDKVDINNGLIKRFFDNTIDEANNRLLDLETQIKEQFTKLQLNKEEINIAPVSKKNSHEILESTQTSTEKVYQKQISSKGIGSLIMELRTPLFMLMPFMMIFALFGALVGGEDLGSIDESVYFYKNRPCVVVNGLPEDRANEYRKFINDVEAARDGKKRVFDKEISAELLTEPQLAVQISEVKQSFGNKYKEEESLDYYFDNKKQLIYLFLTDNGDREFVIEQLLDPENKLLNIPSSTRRGFGLGGLIRALSSLSEYRYIILIGLVSLVLWFIITRKSGMDRDLKNAKKREQRKLNAELRQQIDKNTKHSFQKWKPKFIDELNSRQDELLKIVEDKINKSIKKIDEKRLREEKIVHKRTTALKAEKLQLGVLKSEQRKVQSKLNLLENKIKRMRIS